MEISETLTLEGKQDVMMNEDDEKSQQTFLKDQSDLELRFEEAVEGISERWSRNIEMISRNIPKEAESSQRLPDFQLVDMKIKNMKGSEEKSNASAGFISLNNGKKWCEDLSGLSPSYNNTIAIYDWSQKGKMEDEEREWKEIDKIWDTADIRHVNEASLELDPDIGDVDILCRKSDKSERRQVIKDDRPIKGVAGEQYGMIENYSEDNKIDATRKSMISWKLTNSMEKKDGTNQYFYLDRPSENQMWPKEGKGSASEKHLKEELNCKHNETERNAVEILQIQLEECVKKEICDVGQQQSSRHGVGLRGRKGDQRDGKTATEVGRRLTGENIGDIVIRLEEGKTGNRAKGVLGTSYEDPVRMQTEQILNEHIYTLGEKPISKYFQEYNILGQKSLGIKKSILQHEIFVEQKKSVDTISLEAMKKGQEKSAEGISVVEVPSERQNMEKKPIVSENDRHETTISERVCIEQPGLKDMKEAGLKPLEVVLESIVSVKHGQDAKKIQYEMQYETLDIHPDLIISEITKQGDLKQNGIGIEGNFESGETSEDEFLRLVEKVDIVSTSVI
ncbi:unnamed protein product, partial [Wuchereria bancrofti]